MQLNHTNPESIQQCQELSCCVVLPTFNNQNTLAQVIHQVLLYCEDVFVVNDGSTDRTSKILEDFSGIKVINVPTNQGKGNALKQGFKQAVSHGFDYAITLDTDGQHFPSDIPVLLEELVNHIEDGVLIIGDRNMEESDVFAQSAKGNRVSSYWVRAVTGLDLKDSQSGFRIYPIQKMAKMNFFNITKKFEFEVEAIIRCHWANIPIIQVPINILYDPKQRVSHFRPFMDIARIVVLIIYFLLVKVIYIAPRNFFRRVQSKGFRRFLLEDFLANGDSPRKKALSISLGVFLGLSPLWGFHTVIVLFLAIVLRLNKVIAFAFSNISLPPFIPLVLFASVQTGNLVLGEKSVFTFQQIQHNFDLVQHLESYIVGSLVLSTTAAVTLGLFGYLLLSFFERNKQLLRA